MVADPDRSSDRGFTLIETLVVLLMVGVLATVMVAVIAVVIRNVPGTEARADDSRSYQRLIQWLPLDAASTPPNKFDDSGPWASPPGCAGASGGYLVHMSWQVGANTEVAEYRLVPDGPGGQVQRFRCSSAGSYADTETTDLTSALYGAAATADAVGVTLTLTTCETAACLAGDPSPIVVSAGSRNPADTLPTTTTSSTTTSTTTTTTTSIP